MSLRGSKVVNVQTAYKYSVELEKQFDWAIRDPNSRTNAYCKHCKRSMLPTVAVLRQHEKSITHRNLLQILKSDQIPKFERKRKQVKTESILLRQTLSKTELELNEENEETAVIVVSSSDDQIFSGDVITSCSVNVSEANTPSSHVVGDSVPYTLSVVKDSGIVDVVGTTTRTTSSAGEVEQGLGLVDVNRMNIEEMDLLETEDTMLVLHESESDENQHDAENDDQEAKVEIKNTYIEAPVFKFSSISHYVESILPEILQSFKTGEDHDVIWKCDGASFRVHKCILAISSSYFQDLLMDDESVCIVQTPGLSKDIVLTILCLFYSGKATVNWAQLNEVNEALKSIGCFGCNLTATPKGHTETISKTFEYNTEKLQAEENFVTKSEEAAIDNQSIHPLTLDSIEDFELEADLAFEEEFIDDFDEYVPLPSKEDSSDEELDEEPDIKKETNLISGRKKRKRKMNSKYDFVIPDIKKEKNTDEAKTNSPIDTIATYTLYTRGRGDLSQNLKDDLFDIAEIIDDVKAISVCLSCLSYFDTYEKLKAHKKTVHKKKRFVTSDYSPSIIGKNKYKCKHCDKSLTLKHIVWFVKHVKYCGVDDKKANQLLSPEDVEVKSAVEQSRNEEFSSFVVASRGRNAHEMSRFFFNKDVHTIWGCKICYEVFPVQIEYEKHMADIHQGSDRHGSCYDADSKIFTCMHCNTYRTARHLIHFIYHLKRCLCDSSLGVAEIDDGEDEDNSSQDVVDPWGIVNKPFRVLNERSKWTCEALFGRYIPIIYPCHICYNVFEFEEELKEHFRVNHVGQENCCDNGSHYDKEREVYTCPVCKRDVCHKLKSAIYFIYHLRKCSGETHPVSRSCPQCHKNFTSFRTYMFHTKNNCETKDFMCHICSQSFKDVKYLANHLSYVHSTARPYKCTKCDKSYKRRPELRMHMQTHADTMEYSCEKCGKAFHRKRNLKVHMNTHLSEAEKRYACHVCTHRFSKKSFLVNHLTTHSSFRKFACEICGSQVKTKDSLKQHRKRVHKLTTDLPQACFLKPELELDSKLSMTTTTVVVKEETVIEDFQF